MSLWDTKSWDDITEMSGQILEKAMYLDSRIGGGGGGCSPEQVLVILKELEQLVETAKSPAEWAGD